MATPLIIRRPRALLVAGAMLALVGGGLTPGAGASELVDRNARDVELQVNRDGVALVLYKRARSSTQRHVLYWGAKNGSLRFQYDRSGGWKSRVADWKTFRDACRPYDGPDIRFVVDACKAPDGSYWALQAWRRIVPNGGGSLRRGKIELRISHWTGPLGQLWVKSDWSWGGRFHHLYGQLTYRGRPVRPGKTTSTGYVLDDRGRNIFFDALDSDMGEGWRRVNGILANNPNGQFCYGFTPKKGPYGYPRSGRSKVGRYRASTSGPGVTPDLFLDFRGPDSYRPHVDAVANAEQERLRAGVTGGSCDRIN